MTEFEKGLEIITKRCGNDRDNIISLATIHSEKNGKSIPAVRDVDAYYENGSFYIVTYAKSNKMLEIKENPNVAFSVNSRNISGKAVGTNLGWVLDPKNAELRTKLRRVFSKWYDEANNEADINFCYLEIKITYAVAVTGHGPTTKKYHLDFLEKKIIDEVKELKKREAYYFKFNGLDAIEQGRTFIFKFLKENRIDLEKSLEPVYIFGSYDILKKDTEELEYTLYLVISDKVKLVDEPLKTHVFGANYVRRFCLYKDILEESLSFYNDLKKEKSHNQDSIITEQYLLSKNNFTKSTQVLLLLESSKII
ncbi:hypothetical protein BN85411730 [Alteracholeplasma palmae J233]|uniref:Pyridoxamine 5'-phosphate oxidase putative domain-containing protein n=1 Tax=Alteracholeplasma palmae (strain ATCC 49389 / J233) TaxID=1318466 RepID=U4KQK7_ALTPJ|nr:hypothetical protein [Alteracholeplasma palmae]CCV64750.1 hypothetical protein BN85411730 [Alteracholeplasma palmae J233]